MNRLQWTQAWRVNAGIPVGPTDPSGVASVNDLAIVTWINSENSQAKNNPLDSEEPWPNSTLYNPQGVRNYVTLDDGLNATTATLNDGFYRTLKAVLLNPTTAENAVSAIYWSPWGSKPTVNMLNNVRNNWPSYAGIHVSGTPDINPPSPGVNKKMWLIVLTASGNGYWKINTTNGDVYAQGDAQYHGAPGWANYPNEPKENVLVAGDYITGASGHGNDGYVMITNGGRTYAFGSAHYEG